MHSCCFNQNFVQNTGADTQGVVFVYGLNQFQQTIYTLACMSGNEHSGCIRHVRQLIADVLQIFIHGLIIFFDGIPFVYSNNSRFPSFVGNTGNLCILIGDAFVGVNNQNGNVTAFYGSNGTDDAETFDSAM